MYFEVFIVVPLCRSFVATEPVSLVEIYKVCGDKNYGTSMLYCNAVRRVDKAMPGHRTGYVKHKYTRQQNPDSLKEGKRRTEQKARKKIKKQKDILQAW